MPGYRPGRPGEKALEDTAFVQIWNETPAPKFIRFKHILVEVLTPHSAAIFPSLPARESDRVFDFGCGFGDTAMKLAGCLGSIGELIGVDCCGVFLDLARKEGADSKAEHVFSCLGMLKLRCRRTISISSLPG